MALNNTLHLLGKHPTGLERGRIGGEHFVSLLIIWGRKTGAGGWSMVVGGRVAEFEEAFGRGAEFQRSCYCFF